MSKPSSDHSRMSLDEVLAGVRGVAREPIVVTYPARSSVSLTTVGTTPRRDPSL